MLKMENFESCRDMNDLYTGRSIDYIFNVFGKNNVHNVNYIHRSENEELPVLIAMVQQENITDNSNFLQVFLMKSFKFVCFNFCGLTGFAILRGK